MKPYSVFILLLGVASRQPGIGGSAFDNDYYTDITLVIDGSNLVNPRSGNEFGGTLGNQQGLVGSGSQTGQMGGFRGVNGQGQVTSGGFGYEQSGYSQGSVQSGQGAGMGQDASAQAGSVYENIGRMGSDSVGVGVDQGLVYTEPGLSVQQQGSLNQGNNIVGGGQGMLGQGQTYAKEVDVQFEEPVYNLADSHYGKFFKKYDFVAILSLLCSSTRSTSPNSNCIM